jgi:hypothetical protein
MTEPSKKTTEPSTECILPPKDQEKSTEQLIETTEPLTECMPLPPTTKDIFL